MVPTLEPHNSVTDIPESAWTSTPGPGQLIPQQGASSTGQGYRESRGWGYRFPPPRMVPHRGNCTTQERWYLWFGRGTQHRGPGSCPFSSLPRATESSFCSHDSSLLCPPSAGAHGEWLLMQFCVLSL